MTIKVKIKKQKPRKLKLGFNLYTSLLNNEKIPDLISRDSDEF